MAITQVGTATTDTGTTALTITKPTGVASGDILILTVATNTASVTPVDSWNLVDVQNNAGTTMRNHLYWRLAGGSEGADYDITCTSSALSGGAITAWRGVDTTTPLDDVDSTATTTEAEPATGPTSTATKAGRALYFRQARSTSSAIPMSTAGAASELYDFACTGGGAFYEQAMYLADSDHTAGSVTGLAISAAVTESFNIERTILLASGVVNDTGDAGEVPVTGTAYNAVGRPGISAPATETDAVSVNTINATVTTDIATNAAAQFCAVTAEAYQPYVSAPRPITVSVTANAPTKVSEFHTVAATAYAATVTVEGGGAEPDEALVSVSAFSPTVDTDDTLAEPDAAAVTVEAFAPTIDATTASTAGTVTVSVSVENGFVGKLAPAEAVTVSVEAFDVVGGGETILAEAGEVTATVEAFNQPMRGQSELASATATVDNAAAFIEYNAFPQEIAVSVTADDGRAQTNRPVDVTATANNASVAVTFAAEAASASVTAEDSFIFLDRKVFPALIELLAVAAPATTDLDDILGLAEEVTGSATSYPPLAGVGAGTETTEVSVTAEDATVTRGELAFAEAVSAIWGAEVMPSARAAVDPHAGTTSGTAVAHGATVPELAGHAAATVTAYGASVASTVPAGTVTASVTAEAVTGAQSKSAPAEEVSVSGQALDASVATSAPAGAVTASIAVNQPTTDLDDTLGLAETVTASVSASDAISSGSARAGTAAIFVTVEDAVGTAGQPGPAGEVPVSVQAQQPAVRVGINTESTAASVVAGNSSVGTTPLAEDVSLSASAEDAVPALEALAGEVAASVSVETPAVDSDDILGFAGEVAATVTSEPVKAQVKALAGTATATVSASISSLAPAGYASAPTVANDPRVRIRPRPSSASATVLANGVSSATRVSASEVASGATAYGAAVRVGAPSGSPEATVVADDLPIRVLAEAVSVHVFMDDTEAPAAAEADPASAQATANAVIAGIKPEAGTVQASVSVGAPELVTSGSIEVPDEVLPTVTGYDATVLEGRVPDAETVTLSASAEDVFAFIGETLPAGETLVSASAEDGFILTGAAVEVVDESAATVVAFGASISLTTNAGVTNVVVTAEDGAVSMAAFAQAANTAVAAAFAMEPYIGRLAGEVTVTAQANGLISALYVLPARRTETVPTEDRTERVRVESRVFVIDEDGRTYVIAAENRTIEVDHARVP